MKSKTALEKLKNLYREGIEVLSTKFNNSDYSNSYAIIAEDQVDDMKFKKWKSNCLIVLEQILDYDSSVLQDFKNNVNYSRYIEASNGVSILKSLIENIEDGILVLDEEISAQNDFNEIIENIFLKFHKVAKQLTYRYDNRDTIEINDEYDVQDLLHALLRLNFNDIRPEEWVPSYAGGSKRMDFLIKDINVVIETKMTRKNLRDKKIGEELIIDIANYSKHQNCNRLYCFVYDKDEFIKNASALENDLSGNKDGIDVKVIIVPKF